MEPLNIPNSKTKFYPKMPFNIENNSTSINKIIPTYLNNPLINRFTKDSFFIFDQADNIKYYQSLNNKNLIKLTKDEFFLLNFISTDIRISHSIKEGVELIEIFKDVADKLNKFFSVNQQDSILSKYIKEKIANSPNRSNISCRKLSNEYFKEKGIKVSKSTIIF